MPPPVTGPRTQGYGPTNEEKDSPYKGYLHFNKGYDYGVPEGTDVTSPVEGDVIMDGDNNDGWGYSVWVRDANGYTHQFGHLAQSSVWVGAHVKAGDHIALSGNTGTSTGPHLSYDVEAPNGGGYIDPGQFTGETNMDNGVSGGGGAASMEENIAAAMKAARDAILKRIPTDAEGAEDPLAWSTWWETFSAADAMAETAQMRAEGYYLAKDGFSRVPIAGSDQATIDRVNAEFSSVYQQFLTQYNLNSNDIETGDFNNKISRVETQVKIGDLNASTGASQIDRYIKGLAESRARASAITTAQQEALNTAFPMHEGGRASIQDPQSLLDQYDKTFGVTGQIPYMPDTGLSINDVPSAPTLSRLRAPAAQLSTRRPAAPPAAAATPGINSPAYRGRTSTFGSGPVPQRASLLDDSGGITSYDPGPRGKQSSSINDTLQGLGVKGLGRFYQRNPAPDIAYESGRSLLPKAARVAPGVARKGAGATVKYSPAVARKLAKLLTGY